MATPYERAPFEGKDAFCLALYRRCLRVGIVAFIRETLEIILRTPRINVAIFSFPMYGRLLVCLVAFHCPLAGPGESFALNVGSFFRGLRRRKLGSRCSAQRNFREHYSRSVPAQF